MEVAVEDTPMKEPVAASSCANGGAGGGAGACVDDAPLLEFEPPLIFFRLLGVLLHIEAMQIKSLMLLPRHDG